MAKLFVQSVKCPVCGHANDVDFRFCQRCGYQRKVFRPATAGGVKVNLEEIDARHQQLLNYDQASSYAKQKDSIQK